MKTFTSIAFALVLGALSIPTAAVVAPVSMTEANACSVQMGHPNSCHKGYLKSCRELGYAGACGLGGVRAGNGGYGGHGYARPIGRPMMQRPVYRPMHPHMVRRPMPMHAAAPIPVRKPSFAEQYYARGHASETKALPPSPEQVYQMQAAAGNVTKVAVPCAEGFNRLPNGNCGRWTPN